MIILKLECWSVTLCEWSLVRMWGSRGLLGGLGSVSWPLTRKQKAGRKKTMVGSGGSHNTEVLNCQQQCENDAIKGSWKEEPGEQPQRPDVRRERRALFQTRAPFTQRSCNAAVKKTCHYAPSLFHTEPNNAGMKLPVCDFRYGADVLEAKEAWRITRAPDSDTAFWLISCSRKALSLRSADIFGCRSTPLNYLLAAASCFLNPLVVAHAH